MIERGRETHAGIGKRKSLTPPDVVAFELPCARSAHVGQLDRNKLHVVELARRAEQHAAFVRGAAFRRVRRPCGIAQRDVERRGVRGLVLLPARNRVGEAELGEWSTERALQLPSQHGSVELGGHIRPMRVHRLALDEEALHRIERRELVVLPLQRADVARNAEQRGEEILQMRPKRDQQVRLTLAPQLVGPGARHDQACRQRLVRRLQMLDEQRVDARRAGGRIQIGEGQPVRELQRRQWVGRHGIEDSVRVPSAAAAVAGKRRRRENV